MSLRDRFRIAGALFFVAAITNLIADNIVVGAALLAVGVAMLVASRRHEVTPAGQSGPP